MQVAPCTRETTPGTRDLGIDPDHFHPTISPPTTYPYGGSNTPRFEKSIATGGVKCFSGWNQCYCSPCEPGRSSVRCDRYGAGLVITAGVSFGTPGATDLRHARSVRREMR